MKYVVAEWQRTRKFSDSMEAMLKTHELQQKQEGFIEI